MHQEKTQHQEGVDFALNNPTIARDENAKYGKTMQVPLIYKRKGL